MGAFFETKQTPGSIVTPLTHPPFSCPTPLSLSVALLTHPLSLVPLPLSFSLSLVQLPLSLSVAPIAQSPLCCPTLPPPLSLFLALLTITPLTLLPCPTDILSLHSLTTLFRPTLTTLTFSHPSLTPLSRSPTPYFSSHSLTFPIALS